MTDEPKVDDGQVVSMHYTLHVDGQVVDSSEGKEPLQFIQGMGHIIAGLEHQLYDMKIGEKKDVVVAPKDGYGKTDPEAFMDVPRDYFLRTCRLSPAQNWNCAIKATSPSTRIDEVNDKNIRLNMNHPLAGKELHFSVQIANLRPATNDEVSHGHVHGEGHSH